MPRKVVAWCFRTGHMAWQANDGIFVTFRNICTGTRLKWTILVCVFHPELLTNQRVNSAVVVNPGRNLCYLSLCVCARVPVCVCVIGEGVCVMNTPSDGGRRSRRSGWSWMLSQFGVEKYSCPLQRRRLLCWVHKPANQRAEKHIDWQPCSAAWQTDSEAPESELCLRVNFSSMFPVRKIQRFSREVKQLLLWWSLYFLDWTVKMLKQLCSNSLNKLIWHLHWHVCKYENLILN